MPPPARAQTATVRGFVTDAAQGQPLPGVNVVLTGPDGAFYRSAADNDGVFDPEVLAQPGTSLNVQNGFGFVGSVARFSVEWLLRDDAARQLAYLTLEDAFGKRAPDVLAQAKQAAATAHAPPGHHSGFQ